MEPNHQINGSEANYNHISKDERQDYEKYASLFVFSGGNKAGMEAMDKQKQAEVIYEMSKNSSFFKRAKKLDEDAEQRAEKLQKSFQEVRGHLLRQLESAAQSKLLEYEKSRSFSKICCVLDMDMFYAAVEIRDRPELRELPVAVGGDHMISTSNYVARKYGVRAAMPGFIAKKLCPHLVFVNSNFTKYRQVAEQLRSVIAKYDPNYHSHSLDEVYFDITNAAKERCLHDGQSSPSIIELRSAACVLLQEIRDSIKEVTGGLTSSAGIANNFFLAKICADINKPDGQFELPAQRDEILDFVSKLPTRKIGGIGKVMEKILDKLGMKTMADVREQVPKILYAFKPSSSEFLARVSIGVAECEGQEVLQKVPDGVVTRKSIGCERTYSSKGISDSSELFERLHDICQSLSEDMREENLHGRAVTVKVKDVQFNLHTRCLTCRSYVQSCESIETVARQILESFLPIRIRLLGVSVSKFRNAYDENSSSTGGDGKRQQRLLTSFLSSTATSDSVANSSSVSAGRSATLFPSSSKSVIDLSDQSYDADCANSGNFDGYHEVEDCLYLEDYDHTSSSRESCSMSDTLSSRDVTLVQPLDSYDYSVLRSRDDPKPACDTSVVDLDGKSVIGVDNKQSSSSFSGFYEEFHIRSSQSNKSAQCISPVTGSEIILLDSQGDVVDDSAGIAPALATKQKEATSIECPVCGERFQSHVDNITINLHIDRCLQHGPTHSDHLSAQLGQKRKMHSSKSTRHNHNTNHSASDNVGIHQYFTKRTKK